MTLYARFKRLLSYPDEVQALIASELVDVAARAGRSLRILDVGCGRTSMLAAFRVTEPGSRSVLIGLDAHGPTIEWCRRHGFHDEYLQCDARDMDTAPPVDVVVATDLVEHLEKADALALMAAMEANAALAVMLLTPNGYVSNPYSDDNPFMAHKCGLTVDDLETRGYVCRGVGGPRRMRAAGSRPRGPKVLSMPLLAMLSRGMRRLPRQSFHIFARLTVAPGRIDPDS